MKRYIALIAAIAAVSLVASPAYAVSKNSPEYQRLVELKKKQRAERDAERANPSAKAKGFWAKEADRSGLAGTGAMLKNVATAPGRILPDGKDSSK